MNSTLDLVLTRGDLDIYGVATVDVGSEKKITQLALKSWSFIPAVSVDSASGQETLYLPDAMQDTQCIAISIDFVHSALGNITGTYPGRGLHIIPVGHWRRDRTTDDVALDLAPTNLISYGDANKTFAILDSKLPSSFQIHVKNLNGAAYQPLSASGLAPSTGGSVTHKDWTLILKFALDIQSGL